MNLERLLQTRELIEGQFVVRLNLGTAGDKIRHLWKSKATVTRKIKTFAKVLQKFQCFILHVITLQTEIEKALAAVIFYNSSAKLFRQ